MLVMLVDVSDVVLKIRAVCDVAINKQVWIPLRPEFEPRASLRRVSLHVITVEIEIG